MAEANVRWTGGRTFIGVDSTKHAVLMSSPGEGVGMKASELLLVALATCSSYDVVSILEKRKVDLQKLEVQVSGEQAADPPWPYEKIHLKYILSGEGVTREIAEKAIELSESKYCSVSATVRGVAKITWECVIE
ncbi:OsmC family protein [Pelolinea submarina]|uniref:Putative redox protein n=1 Tax=Pelolinea submarina TaxID=913107 RepID=A0A347ZNH8_9CHLR|nr:OsmC family protein [Pelolinea submarina]REG08461.1 putative redox protein [Pelolinea submarina]BBB46859.1 OsmC/Ohr family protein [Pelolinea submarina]